MKHTLIIKKSLESAEKFIEENNLDGAEIKEIVTDKRNTCATNYHCFAVKVNHKLYIEYKTR